jgi:hypothetical protein
MSAMTATSGGEANPSPDKGQKFSDILSNPLILDRWRKVKKWFFLRESTYDMTNRCNIRCNGCYYYEGEKQFAKENKGVDDWRRLMQLEKGRGITYVVLAGAEPSLALDLCEVCHQEIPLGAIATNGLIMIPAPIQYRIHISVWGSDETSLKIRKAKNMLQRQIDNYRGDPRAVFVYTFTRDNVNQAQPVAEILSAEGCRLTFNMFSAPVGYNGSLRHNVDSLKKCRIVMTGLLEKFPQNVLFSSYNAVVHTHTSGLHDLFTCPYPRRNPATDIGLGRSFRQYRTDLSWDRRAACCVPDTDCEDCRHYASGSAVVTARMFRHTTDQDIFKAWLDYVDTYLAVWVMGYEKGPNLSNSSIAPPGQELL